MLSLNLNELEELYEITKDERIRDFMKELEGVNTLPEFRQFITEEQDIQFIMNTEREEGMAEGEKIDEKRGVLKSKFEIARNMLREKFSIETISRITGLAINQIKNITL